MQSWEFSRRPVTDRPVARRTPDVSKTDSLTMGTMQKMLITNFLQNGIGIETKGYDPQLL